MDSSTGEGIEMKYITSMVAICCSLSLAMKPCDGGGGTGGGPPKAAPGTPAVKGDDGTGGGPPTSPRPPGAVPEGSAGSGGTGGGPPTAVPDGSGGTGGGPPK